VKLLLIIKKNIVRVLCEKLVRRGVAVFNNDDDELKTFFNSSLSNKVLFAYKVKARMGKRIMKFMGRRERHLNVTRCVDVSPTIRKPLFDI
jgi:hypothetical protein